MTVSRLKRELTLSEYFGWAEYFKQQNPEPEEKAKPEASFLAMATPYKGG